MAAQIGLFEPRPEAAAKSWATSAPSKAKALRALLADGHWHHMQELQKVAGWRYGARLLEVRRGEDGGPPLRVEKRRGSSDMEWQYRAILEVGP